MKNEMTTEERATYKSNYDATHHVSNVSKIPKTPHYAVIVNESKSYPDSYSSSGSYMTDSYTQYIYFDNEQALNAWVLDQSTKAYGHKEFRVFYVNPVEVKLHTTMEIVK